MKHPLALLLIGLMLGLVLGVGIGRWSAPEPAPTSSVVAWRAPEGAATIVPNDEQADTPDPGAAQDRASTRQLASAPEPPEAQALRGEVRLLQKRVERLKSSREELRRELVGEPTDFPDDLPERFEEQKLRETIEASLRESGVDGVIEKIDCEEFPCMVYGVIASDTSEESARADLMLLHRSAQKTYKSDPFYISQTTQMPLEEGGDTMLLFNMSYYPEDMDAGQKRRVEKRMKARKDRYFEENR